MLLSVQKGTVEQELLYALSSLGRIFVDPGLAIVEFLVLWEP